MNINLCQIHLQTVDHSWLTSFIILQSSINPLKTEFLLNNIYKSSSYLTRNTLRLRYKAQPLFIVRTIWNREIHCVKNAEFQRVKHVVFKEPLEFKSLNNINNKFSYKTKKNMPSEHGLRQGRTLVGRRTLTYRRNLSFPSSGSNTMPSKKPAISKWQVESGFFLGLLFQHWRWRWCIAPKRR
jgi:hypothetical protein